MLNEKDNLRTLNVSEMKNILGGSAASSGIVCATGECWYLADIRDHGLTKGKCGVITGVGMQLDTCGCGGQSSSSCDLKASVLVGPE
jgi:hypothetical protein